MTSKSLDQHSVYSKITSSDVISVFAVLIVVSTAAGNETTVTSSEKISNPATSETSVITNATTTVAPTTVANGRNVIRSSVVHSTISYLSENIISHNSDRGFVVPHFHLSDSRWGPFFEEGPEPHNVTARVGSTVTLDCRIGLLHDRTVTWLHHKNDSIHLLTVGRNAYSSDERITLSFRYPNNWRLEIVYVTRQDQGLYECQVATHPPKVKRIFLKVIAPELTIVDDLGRQVTERYYKAGSSLELTCLASQTEGHGDVMNVEDHEVIWRHGDRILKQGISYNFSNATNTVTFTLMINPVTKNHSGNYTCSIDGMAAASVSVHILNDELPAAVYHGNSASQQSEKRYFITLPFVLLLVSTVR